MTDIDKKRILVTGGAGFIGSHLADRLLDGGHEVIIVDNLKSGAEANIPEEAIFVEADVCGDLTRVFEEGIDVVYHLAAQVNVRESIANPVEDAKVNVLGSLNVFKTAHEYDVEHIIFFSSGGAVYDPDATLPHTETSAIAPASPYGLSKYAAEEYLKLFETDAIRHTILRPSNVYGPRQGENGEAGVISIFITRALDGKELTVFGDGEQTRDFIFVSDVARAATTVLDAGMSGVYNVSTGDETSVNDIVEAMDALLDDPVSIRHEDAIAGEVRESVISSDTLQQQSDWSPAIDVDEGIHAMISYANAQ